MIPGNRYKITATIKLHTSPLRLLTYDKTGRFVKETEQYLIFDSFRVKKSTVIGQVAI